MGLIKMKIIQYNAYTRKQKLFGFTESVQIALTIINKINSALFICKTQRNKFIYAGECIK